MRERSICTVFSLRDIDSEINSESSSETMQEVHEAPATRQHTSALLTEWFIVHTNNRARSGRQLQLGIRKMWTCFYSWTADWVKPHWETASCGEVRDFPEYLVYARNLGYVTQFHPTTIPGTMDSLPFRVEQIKDQEIGDLPKLKGVHVSEKSDLIRNLFAS